MIGSPSRGVWNGRGRGGGRGHGRCRRSAKQCAQGHCQGPDQEAVYAIPELKLLLVGGLYAKLRGKAPKRPQLPSRSLGYSFFVAVALAIGLSARRLRTQR